MKFFWLFIFYIITPLYAFDHSLAVISIFKDEAPYFREWIEYHKMMGVTHFRLYNNDSHDNYLEVLSPYIESGEVTLIEWPSSAETLKSWTFLCQWPAIQEGLLALKDQAEWVAIIDIDEFLHPLEDDNMVTFLKRYTKYPAVVLSWQCFGTSFVDEIPEGDLLIETLTMKAESKSLENRAVKSIVQPSQVDLTHFAWPPHTFHYLDKALAVFPDKTPRPEGGDPLKWYICDTIAIINHYSHRTESYFWNDKIAKKLRMENGGVINAEYVDYWYNSMNQERDYRILRFAQELKEGLLRELKDKV